MPASGHQPTAQPICESVRMHADPPDSAKAAGTARGVWEFIGNVIDGMLDS